MHVGGGLADGADDNVHGLVQQHVCQLAYALLERRREQERLPPWPHLTQGLGFKIIKY